MNRQDLTTPAINILQGDPKLMQQQMSEFITMRPIGVSSIKHNQNKLGKQKRCQIVGWNRCWIWEGDNWRIFVSKRGVSFEVLENLTIAETWLAWQDYYERVK